jgi:hypothetical protein
VTPCVLDQFYDNWLFSDALNSSFDSFMEEDLGIANKLGLFVFNIKKHICDVFNISFHF